MNPEKEKDMQLLELYWEEWKYRHENFWKRMTQFFIAIAFLSVLPLIYQSFIDEAIKLNQFSLSILPGLSIVLSLFFLWYGFSESVRLIAVNEKINALTRENFEGRSFLLISVTARRFLKIRISKVVPWLFFSMELLIAGYILLIIWVF